MATVELKSVEKFYGAQKVLHSVDVDIADGEFVVLVGPSGCGKSTLLRMVAGLEEISAGSVSIGGVVVNDLPPKKRDLAMVFQSYALYPHMTVSENMGFSLRLAKMPKSEIQKQVSHAAEILGLSDYLDRYPRHLSGGQRQRVAMGRAIVRNPQVFLFDEPLSNLDAKLRAQMRSEIKLMHARLETTTIYVTHDQTEAMTMADKIAVLRDGRVEQIGPPQELYNAPRNAFVAGFIGSPTMNFFPGKVESGTVTSASGMTLRGLNIHSTTVGEITYGVRPKHFSIYPEQGDVEFHMDVEIVELTGDEMEVRGHINGESAVAVIPNTDVHPGSRLNLYVAASNVYLFENSGDRNRII